MDWKMGIALHWKVVFAMLQILLVATAMVYGQCIEPIDNPGGP